MARMHVAFLLDLFQPATQTYTVLDEVARECYQPLVDLFNSDLNPKFTVSLASSLAQLLIDYGKRDIIDGMKTAVECGKVELIHTGSDHPIFPLITEREVRRQIELDVKFKEDQFGLTRRTGILSPELCYSDRLTPLYKDLGFTWTVMDDQLMGMHGIRVPDREIYSVSDFVVLMRSSFWSDRISKQVGGKYLTGRELIEDLALEAAGRDHESYKVVCLSGETFGHHVKYFEETLLRDMLFALTDCESVRLSTVSELLRLESFPRVEKRRETGKGFEYFPLSSWATEPEHYRRGDPFPHWRSNGNPIHEQLWALTDLVLESCRGINFDDDNPAYDDLRKALDRAFYSPQYFWASIFYWRPEIAYMIYQGIDRQMRALYKCARLIGSERILEEGQKIYARLMWAIYEQGGRP